MSRSRITTAALERQEQKIRLRVLAMLEREEFGAGGTRAHSRLREAREFLNSARSFLGDEHHDKNDLGLIQKYIARASQLLTAAQRFEYTGHPYNAIKRRAWGSLRKGSL